VLDQAQKLDAVRELEFERHLIEKLQQAKKAIRSLQARGNSPHILAEGIDLFRSARGAWMANVAETSRISHEQMHLARAEKTSRRIYQEFQVLARLLFRQRKDCQALCLDASAPEDVERFIRVARRVYDKAWNGRCYRILLSKYGSLEVAYASLEELTCAYDCFREAQAAAEQAEIRWKLAASLLEEWLSEVRGETNQILE